MKVKSSEDGYLFHCEDPYGHFILEDNELYTVRRTHVKHGYTVYDCLSLSPTIGNTKYVSFSDFRKFLREGKLLIITKE